MGATYLQINSNLAEMTETSDEQISLRGIQYFKKYHQGSHVTNKVETTPIENWAAEEDNDNRYKWR